MKNRIFIYFTILAVALASIALPAQEKKEKQDKEKKKDPVYKLVVTASRREAQQKDIPASTSIVTKEEINNSAGLAIEDALKAVPGVDLWGSSMAYKCAHGLTLRGTETMGRTLVLIDGMPLNDPWDDWVDWNLATLDDTEKIEIVRGPSSSLYGSNAMGGVINIISSPLRNEPLYSHTSFKYGSMNSLQTGFKVGGVADQITWQLKGHGKRTDGYYAYAVPQNNESKNESSEYNLGGKMGWQLDENTNLVAAADYMHHERNRGRKYQKVDPQDIKRFSLKFNRKEEDIVWDAHVYYQDEHLKWYLDKGPNWDAVHFAEDIYSTFWGASVNPKFFWNKNNTLTVGAEVKFSDIEKEDIYYSEVRDAFQGGKQDYLSLFAQNETSLLSGKAMLSLGGRVDYYRNSDGFGSDTNPHQIPAFDQEYADTDWTSFNPKVSFIYDLTPMLSFRTSLGTAFRAPSPARQFLNLTRGPFLYTCNPDLKPENMVSWEAGLDLHLDEGFIRGTYYYSKGDDFIGSRVVRAPFYYVMDNINKVTISGVELEFKKQLNKYFAVSSSYVYNKSVITEDTTNPLLVDNDLLHSPRNKFNIMLNYHNPQLGNLHVTTRFIDKMYDDLANTRELFSYWTTDLKYRKRISKQVAINLECINLFDEEYLLPSYDTYKAPGRVFMAGFELDY